MTYDTKTSWYTIFICSSDSYHNIILFQITDYAQRHTSTGPSVPILAESCVNGYSSRHTISCMLISMTQHCPKEPESVIVTMCTPFFCLCHLSLSLSLSLCLSLSLLLCLPPCCSSVLLTASPSPIPPFLTQQNKSETRSSDCCCCGDRELGDFSLPSFLVLQDGEAWGGVGQEGVRNMKVWQRLRKDTTGGHFGLNEIEKNFISSTVVTKSPPWAAVRASGSDSLC